MNPVIRIVALVAIAAASIAAAPVTDLATPFVAWWDRTTGLPEPARVVSFKREIAARFPAFYAASRSGGEARFDARIARALERFGPQRDAFAAKAAGFGGELPRHVATFRAAFPDFALTAPIYLLHSLGEMDGGTRDLGGETDLIFGVDVMVAAHGTDGEAAFFHHELFHTYHARAFPECPAVWCALWSEGLAVYVARRLDPDATDRQLLLASPPDMLAVTKARLPEALADLEASLDSTDPDVVDALFTGGDAASPLPHRRGYFLGLLVAEEVGRTHDLRSLAHLTHAQAKPLIVAAVHTLRERAG